MPSRWCDNKRPQEICLLCERFISNTTSNWASRKGAKDLTHCKLPSNAIRWVLVLSFLTLQLCQEVSQQPGLMLHGRLNCTHAGIGHLSPACQDTEVPVRRSWSSVAGALAQGGDISITAVQSTSLLLLSRQRAVVKGCVNCLWGSKSQPTGSVVALKALPRPLGVSHWAPTSAGCLIAWQCHRD